jgi:flagellin
MAVTIGSNITSSIARRNLDRAGDRVAETLTRLSSGLRINRASDDAAGLAISTSLRTDARVFGQGLRNLSDGISALSIADSTLGELGSVAIRLRELATQSANGTFSLTQRRALQTESDQLISEFNRVIGTTSFNGLKLYDGSLSDLRLQAGYGIAGGIGVGIGQELRRTRGTGSFSVSSLGLASTDDGTLADVNGDGRADLLVSSSTSVQVRLSNGDGTFGAATNVNFSGNVIDFAVGDLNGDGAADIVAISAGNQLASYSGTGQGTFGAAQVLASLSFTGSQIFLADTSGDGRLDIITNASGGGGYVFSSTASGSYVNSGFNGFGGIGATRNIRGFADLNGDGRSDIITGAGDSNFGISLSNGDGSFGAYTSLTGLLIESGESITWGDFNRDGTIDLAYVNNGYDLFIRNGNGDGTFQAARTIGSTTGSGELSAGDYDNDGYLDLLVGFYGQNSSVLFGNGAGSFNRTTTFSNGLGSGLGAAQGDIDGDGVTDLLYQVGGNISIGRAQTATTNTASFLDLLSQSSARSSLTTIDGILDRLNRERGLIGASQSRIESAFAALGAARENSLAAESRISNADIASESAELVRATILQQAASGLLAQANAQPALALQLLGR